MLKLSIIQVYENKVTSYFADNNTSSFNIELTGAEQQEFANLGKKILNRFASEIIADQVQSDSFRAKPEAAETTNGLVQEVKDPNQMELPLTGVTTTATQLAEEKPKRGRKIVNVKIPEGIKGVQTIEEVTVEQLNSLGEYNAKVLTEAKPATIETVLLTIDDLRTAVQEFISRNGKTEVAAQTAKLKTLFATYGGSDVSTFPKNKIAECIAKIQSL